MSPSLPACCPRGADESCLVNPYLTLQTRPQAGHDLITTRVVPAERSGEARHLYAEWIELWGIRRHTCQGRLLARAARCPGYGQASFQFRVKRPDDYIWFYAKAFCVWPRPGPLT